MTYHLVNGKKTEIGHIVHYIDHANKPHAALVKSFHGDAHNTANLHVFHQTNGSDNHVEDVPHSATPAPHTWHHIPE